MNQMVTVEQRVLMGSLHTLPTVHDLLTRHRIEWMARSMGSYSEEIMREFYPSYVETLKGTSDRRSNPNKHILLTDVQV